MTENEILQELFECAQIAGQSQDKCRNIIQLPQLLLPLANQIITGKYRPNAFTVFAITDPKLREIFAPSFADRLVQHWLIHHIEPWFDARFILDSYANRKGRGTQSAINRLQHFMRMPANTWLCKLDIRAFFPSIDRRMLLYLWRNALPKLPFAAEDKILLDQVATTILMQNPCEPAPIISGNRALLKQIPAHKSLRHTPDGIGIPIGSLSSQFFANVYLNKLDQFIKHRLKIKSYLRYVDDFIILGDNPNTLLKHKAKIEQFLAERLHLQIHPQKVVLQPTHQGVDFLGQIVFKQHRLIRQRSVRALRQRIAWFNYLISASTSHHFTQPQHGQWQRWIQNNRTHLSNGEPSNALLKRILSTLNSYYGLFQHAHTYQLRKHIYHRELGNMQRYFLPADGHYSHLKIRKHWLMRSEY